jgi:hypothetical protein
MVAMLSSGARIPFLGATRAEAISCRPSTMDTPG